MELRSNKRTDTQSFQIVVLSIHSIIIFVRDLQQTLGRPIIVTGYPRSTKSETMLAFWQMVFDLKVSFFAVL